MLKFGSARRFIISCRPVIKWQIIAFSSFVVCCLCLNTWLFWYSQRKETDGNKSGRWGRRQREDSCDGMIGSTFYNVQYMRKYHHHHHVVPLALISPTLSRHFSLSFIAFGMSSGLHPESSHSCYMYVRPSRPAFARPYVDASLMSSSLLVQQCPACLVRLIWIVFLMGCMCPYSLCLVACCRQDLFNIARDILV